MGLIFGKSPLISGRPYGRPIQKARLSDIEALAEKLTPKLADAILKALSAQADSVDLDTIATALQHGNVADVLAALGLDEVEAVMGVVQDGITDATFAGGALAAATLNTRLQGATFAFNRLNPRLITWLQNYSLALIRQINETTREGVRQYLVTGMNQGKSPIAMAREVKGIVGLTNRQAQAVANFRKELETFHTKRSAKAWNLGGKIDRVNNRQVFKPTEDGTPADGIDARRLRDFRFDGQLKAAIESKKPLTKAQIDKMVAGYERKYRRYRSETIARTEALRATNAGVQDAWRQAIEGGKVVEAQVRRQWIVSRDERLCEICAPIPRMNPKIGVTMGQPFATPKGPTMLPPMHPSCRCTVFIRVWEPEQLADANEPAPAEQPKPDEETD